MAAEAGEIVMGGGEGAFGGLGAAGGGGVEVELLAGATLRTGGGSMKLGKPLASSSSFFNFSLSFSFLASALSSSWILRASASSSIPASAAAGPPADSSNST